MKNSTIKNVLVTGGSGFIGSYMADKLSKCGYKVTIFDKNPSKFLNSHQTFISGDLNDIDSIKRASRQVDAVFHFGGVAQLSQATNNPVQTLQTNVIGTARLLNVMCDLNINHLVFASTMYVHGSHGSFYKISKESAEALISEYAKEKPIKYLIARLGSLYGSRAQSWNLVNQIFMQIFTHGRVDLYRDPSEKREFIHVEDATQICLDQFNSGLTCQRINITGVDKITLEELVLLAFEIVNLKPKYTFHGQQKKDQHYFSTPYDLRPNLDQKAMPAKVVDLSSGLLEVAKQYAK